MGVSWKKISRINRIWVGNLRNSNESSLGKKQALNIAIVGVKQRAEAIIHGPKKKLSTSIVYLPHLGIQRDMWDAVICQWETGHKRF